MRKLACCLMVVALAACADKSKGPNLSGGDPSDGVGAAGAGGESSGTSASGGEPTAEGGAAGGPLEPAASLDEVYEQLDELQGADRKGLQSLYPVELSQGVDYNPLDAEFLDRIQDSALAMNDEELDVFRQNGFAISKRQQFATVFMGYASIYSEDLPVYISADAILDAVHRSYDAILMAIEEGELIDELDSLLSDLDSALGAATAREEALADATLYLAVARSLLAGAAGSDLDSEGQTLYSKATEASGIETLSLFGSERLVDFSQFAPRGHYANTSSLQNYFRAMMWLGRIDFRVIETLSDGAEVVRREQFEAMLKNIPEVEHYFVIVGSRAVNELISFSQLKPWEERKRTQMEIVRELQPKLRRVTGVRAFANNPGSFGQSARSKPIEFVIQTSDSYDKLNEYVARFLAEAEKNPGLINLDSDLRLNKPQIDVDVDRERVADTGAGVLTVGRTLETLLGGRQVTRFNQNGEQYDVIVQVAADDRRTP